MKKFLTVTLIWSLMSARVMGMETWVTEAVHDDGTTRTVTRTSHALGYGCCGLLVCLAGVGISGTGGYVTTLPGGTPLGKQVLQVGVITMGVGLLGMGADLAFRQQAQPSVLTKRTPRDAEAGAADAQARKDQ